MKNTKLVLSLIAATGVCFAWGVGHVLFWMWVFDDSSYWALAASLTTSMVAPALIAALVADWNDRRCK